MSLLTEPLMSHFMANDDGDPLFRVGGRLNRVDQNGRLSERYLETKQNLVIPLITTPSPLIVTYTLKLSKNSNISFNNWKSATLMTFLPEMLVS